MNSGIRERVEVPLGDRTYPILIGAASLGEVGEAVAGRLPPARGTARALVVSHPEVAARYAAPVVSSLARAGFHPVLAEVPAGERSKSFEQVTRLYDRAIEASLDRSSPVVALGGGVIGDLAGFVAATFLRGLPFVQIPTTLLAQVDSSVGGKVGVNHPLAKNAIGAFHQPVLVFTDVGTLATLPEAEFRSGLAEVVKHGVIADADYFAFLEAQAKAIAARAHEALIPVIAGSCRIKAAVVAADEREGRTRMILNFGHTIGHAIESVTGYRRFRHGEAVAMGMIAAGRIAVRRRLWSEAEYDRLERLLARFELPRRIPGLPVDELVRATRRDKKGRGGIIRWILPERIGTVRIVDDVSEDEARTVLRELGASEGGTAG